MSLQLYSNLNKDYARMDIKKIDDLKGRNDIKANVPTAEECYTAQEPNTNTFATGQWCIVKDTSTGKWAILLELDHWEFAHYMPYNGQGMGTVGLYTTAKVAKQNAQSMWPNATKVHTLSRMRKDIFIEYLEVI